VIAVKALLQGELSMRVRGTDSGDDEIKKGVNQFSRTEKR